MKNTDSSLDLDRSGQWLGHTTIGKVNWFPPSTPVSLFSNELYPLQLLHSVTSQRQCFSNFHWLQHSRTSRNICLTWFAVLFTVRMGWHDQVCLETFCYLFKCMSSMYLNMCTHIASSGRTVTIRQQQTRQPTTDPRASGWRNANLTKHIKNFEQHHLNLAGNVLATT